VVLGHLETATMMNGLQHLVHFWKDFPFADNVHPMDEPARSSGWRLTRGHDSSAVDAFFSGDAPSGPCLDLAPVPYLGNLDTSDIFLLMRNPALSKTAGYQDYGTDSCPEFQEALRRNIHQTEDNKACLALDPRFWWSSWFAYYEKFLRPTIREYSVTEPKKTYLEALQTLSNRLAIIELAPYYSANANWISNSRFSGMGSLERARGAAKYVQQMAQDKDRKALLVGRWKIEPWHLKGDGIVLNEGRDFERGEKAIVTWLAENPTSRRDQR
jgi:hypothetical protein